MSSGLSVGDGFKFGCGFILAAFIAWLAIAIVGGILAAVFGATLGALLSRFSEQLGMVLPLLGLI